MPVLNRSAETPGLLIHQAEVATKASADVGQIATEHTVPTPLKPGSSPAETQPPLENPSVEPVDQTQASKPELPQ